MKKRMKIAAAVLAGLLLALAGICVLLHTALPGQLTVVAGQPLTFARTKLLTVNAGSGTASVRPVEADANAGGYSARIKLFGVVPVKTVWVSEMQQTTVGVSGAPFGIKLYSDGVMIVGFTDIHTATGYRNPAKEAGLRMGDTVYEIDGELIADNADIQSAVENSDGRPLTVRFFRKGEESITTVVPVRQTESTTYRIGMRVRDSTAGIGTLTFICPDSAIYAGLGHGVTDADTGEEIPLLSGQIVPVEITEYTQSSSGEPGELRGILDVLSVGDILKNDTTGVFGRLYTAQVPFAAKLMPVALRQDITPGPASLVCCIDGTEPVEYAVEIERIRYSEENLTKNMIIHVTDTRLVEKTGGIVQGMSGSPILQNGKLVGALTHVLVNDPTRGYAIFAENMLQVSDQLTNEDSVRDR